MMILSMRLRIQDVVFALAFILVGWFLNDVSKPVYVPDTYSDSYYQYSPNTPQSVN